MKYYITALVLSLASAAGVGAAISDTLVYKEGDLKCSGQPVKLTRVQNGGICTPVKCFATKQGKNLPDSTSSETMCSESIDDYSKISSGKYALMITYGGSSSCEDSKIVQIDGLLADGSCHRVGNGYFKAECSTNGPVQSWLCPDSSCSTGCTPQFVGQDGKCIQSTKYTCTASGKKTAADSSASSVVPTAAIFGALYWFLVC